MTTGNVQHKPFLHLLAESAVFLSLSALLPCFLPPLLLSITLLAQIPCRCVPRHYGNMTWIQGLVSGYPVADLVKQGILLNINSTLCQHRRREMERTGFGHKSTISAIGASPGCIRVSLKWSTFFFWVGCVCQCDPALNCLIQVEIKCWVGLKGSSFFFFPLYELLLVWQKCVLWTVE